MIILDLFTVDCISLVVDVETYYIFCVFKIHTVYHHITCNLRSFLGSLLPHHPYHPCPFWESLHPEFRAPLDHLFPDLSAERSFQSRGKNCSKSYQKNYPTRPHFQNNTPKQSLLSANGSFHPLGGVPYLFWPVSLPRFLCFHLQPSKKTTLPLTRVTAPKNLENESNWVFDGQKILYSFFTITSIVQLSKVLEAGPKNQL